MFHHHASSPCLKKICCYCVFQCICFHLQAIATQLYHNQAHIFLSFASTHNTLQCLGYFDPWQPYQGRLVTNWISSWKKEENEPKLLHCCDVHWICKINKTFGHFLWGPDVLKSLNWCLSGAKKSTALCLLIDVYVPNWLYRHGQCWKKRENYYGYLCFLFLSSLRDV